MLNISLIDNFDDGTGGTILHFLALEVCIGHPSQTRLYLLCVEICVLIPLLWSQN